MAGEKRVVCPEGEQRLLDLEAAIQKAISGESKALDSFVLKMTTDKGVSASELNAMGDRLSHLGAIEHALKLYLRSLVLDDVSAKTWCAAAISFHHLGQLQKAISHYRVALAKDPMSALIHSNLAIAYGDLGDDSRGKQHTRHALTLEPESLEALYNMGLALERDLDKPLAIRFYDRAVARDPFFAQARTNRGKQLQEMSAFPDAIRDHQNALILAPGLEEAMHNRATILSELREFDASITAFHRALSLNHHFPNAHLALSMTLLMVERYLEGWAENEWRFLEYVQHGVRAQSGVPKLTPEALEGISGKKVLLFWEQGLGDTIHFCRYAKLLADRGAKVILNVQRELLPLVSLMDERIEVTDSSRDRPDCDYHAYLMSLPFIFRTEVETIPALSPYFFAPNDCLDRWAKKIQGTQRPKVGLVFSGAPSFKNDHNRSIPLAHFTPLLALPLEFHCLQKEIRPGDAALASDHGNFYEYRSGIESFADTAAIADQMDLVISVDTSVAHLVGALGKPLWLMLPYTPDNRWFLSRDDSPWYPSARIYRQDQDRVWMPVIAQIRLDLIQRFALEA